MSKNNQLTAAEVNGYDSADLDLLTKAANHFPTLTVIHTRCAGSKDNHSVWAYGPMFTSPKAAKKAGYTHREQCECGLTRYPL